HANGIRLLDIASERQLPPPREPAAFTPIAIALPPDGTELAVMSTTGQIQIWDLPRDGAPVLRTTIHRGNAGWMTFLDQYTLAVSTAGGTFSTFHTRAQDPDFSIIDISLPGATKAVQDETRDLIVASTADGHIAIIDRASGQVTQRIPVCDGHLNDV